MLKKKKKKSNDKESKMDKNNVSSSNKPEKRAETSQNLKTHTHVLLVLIFFC